MATDPAWVARRLEMFQRTALPSMQSQSFEDWVWILLSTVDTSPGVRTMLKEHQQDQRIVVRYLDSYGPSVFTSVVREHLRAGENGKWITTRLDVDDVIATDYLLRIRQVAADNDDCPYFINFDSGLQLDMGDKRFYATMHPSNMFLSRVECGDVASPVTVMAVEHQTVARDQQVINVRTAPMWVHTYHADNRETSPFRAARPVLASGLDSRFDAPAVEEAVRHERSAGFTDRLLWRARIAKGRFAEASRKLARRLWGIR